VETRACSGQQDGTRHGQAFQLLVFLKKNQHCRLIYPQKKNLLEVKKIKCFYLRAEKSRQEMLDMRYENGKIINIESSIWFSHVLNLTSQI